MHKHFLLFATMALAGWANAQSPCDTVNLPTPQNWTSNCYASLTAFPGVIEGYISGVNSDHFVQQANYFDLSSTSYAFILGTAVKFSLANSSNADSLAMMLSFRVYADNNGVPGAEITTPQTLAQVPLSKVKSDVANGALTSVSFPSAIALPASKKFYVSVDMSNFQWSPNESIRDSICISATGDNETGNAAWNFDADISKWKPYNRSWGAPPDEVEPLDATLYIFPYVSLTSAGGCSILPVTLLSFSAEKNNKNVTLHWQAGNEVNMKGYEVQKAGSNGAYTTIEYVSAMNGIGNTNYSAADANAFAGSSSVQYRLKQINNDGSFVYSKTVSLQSDASGIVFQNPFAGSMIVRLTMTTPQTVSVHLYDMQGKMVSLQSGALLSAGVHTITLAGTASIRGGSYILKVSVGNEIYTYKVMKQNG